jgi:SAM-dependent methyltransferase
MPLTATDAVARRDLDLPLAPRGPVVTEPAEIQGQSPLSLLPASCPLCGDVEAFPLGVSEDFTYHISPDAWLPLRCSGCGSVFVSPTPTAAMEGRLYPAQYHAAPAASRQAGLVAGAQRRAEWRALRRWIGPLEAQPRIIDVGYGGGHGVRRLKDEFGEAVSLRQGGLEDLAAPTAHCDLALLIHTLEHLTDPVAALQAVRTLLRPGGRALVVVFNLSSPCFRLFQGRHWGGYDLPRQRVLYSKTAVHLLADRCGLEVENVVTAPDPVCWTESVHRLLTDWHAPAWLARRFAPGGLVMPGLFAILERVLDASGRGGSLVVTLRRPAAKSGPSA